MSHDPSLHPGVAASAMPWSARLATVCTLVGSLILSACAAPVPGPSSRPLPASAQATPAPAVEPMPAYVEQWLRAGPPERLALLLPLSGPFATTASAVRDGFMAQHFDSRAASSVRVYDVGDSPEQLRRAYQQALDEDNGFIVGPLKKEGVAQLAAINPPVPVLGLNYLDDGAAAPFNFFQYGLAPEDEARAAADDAVAHSLRRAVALVPDNDWGARVLAAFDARLQQAGGRVVASATYRQGVSDQSDVIAQLMGVRASEERHRALNDALGQRTEFESRRRGDVDFVFLGARSADARVLLPQFRFYRATGLPHYATSLVYDGSVDRDLVGLRFCDMPFRIGADDEWLRERDVAALIPSTASYPQLYALGRDAYRLAVALGSGALRVGDGTSAAGGMLEWADSSALMRRLDCVEMQPDGLVATVRR